MQRTHPEFHRGTRQTGQAAAPSSPWPLVTVLLAVPVLAALLWRVGGAPQRPEMLTDSASLAEVLTASEITDADLIAGVTTLAWLVIGYLTAVVTLRAAALGAERATSGARWARTALRLTNLITIPAVRRVVDGGVAGTLLLSSWMPTPGRAIAAAVVAQPPVTVTPIAVQGSLPDTASHFQEQAPEAQFVRYTVAAGEDLWGIARRLYGDGSRYVSLFEANRGRVMSDGERFTDPRVLHAGWVLFVPLPARNVDVSAEAASYRVSPGDHLWGIAERFLGDGFRWAELWEANRDREMDDGRRFADPNLIYPGWMLDLPDEVATSGPPLADPSPLPFRPSSEGVTESPVTPGPVDTAPDGNEESATDGQPGLLWEWPEVPREVLVTAAGFVVLGSAVLFVQRLRRAGLLAVPQLIGRRVPQPGDAGRVALLTRGVLAALSEGGVAGARVMRVDESATGVTLTIAAPGAESVISAAEATAGVLGAGIDCQVLGADRVEVRVVRPGATALAVGARAAGLNSLVVPVGVGAEVSSEVVYLDLAGIGSVAVAGDASECRRLLHDWLATLATTDGPDRLVFRSDAATAALLGADASLPHFGGADAATSTADLADELIELIRSRSEGEEALPAVLALVDASVPEASATVERLIADGPSVGVYVASLYPSNEVAPEGFGAEIRLGGAPASEDSDATGRGQIEVIFASGEQILLDPVLVRRDTSSRWLESATAVDNIGGLRGDGGDFPRDDGGAAGPRSPEPSGGGFNWHRALFEEPASRGPSPDEESPEPARYLDAAHEVEQELTPSAMQTAIHSSDDVEPEAQVDVPDEPPAVGIVTDPDEISVSSTQATSRGNPASAAPAVRQDALFLDVEAQPSAVAGTSSVEGLVRVTCFGGLQVETCGIVVSSWSYEKGRELLALLVAHGGAALPRQAAAELLWPDYGWDASVKHMMSNAATSLRSAVRSAAGRKDLQVLVLGQGRYSLLPGAVRSDLDDFEAGLRRAASLPDEEALDEYEQALALYRGPFLAYEPFAWAESYQREYLRRFVDAALRAGDAASRAGAYERAANFYRNALEREPSGEEAARGLMRSLGALGDPNGVRKVYRVLAEALQDELDEPRAAPSPETQALFTALTRQAAVG